MLHGSKIPLDGQLRENSEYEAELWSGCSGRRPAASRMFMNWSLMEMCHICKSAGPTGSSAREDLMARTMR